MDNRVIDVRSEGREAFGWAVSLLFDNAPGGKATHFRDDPERGLTLFWNPERGAVPLVFPMDAEQAAEVAWGWLQEQPDSRYIDSLDHDGSNGRGFRVYNEDWGHVGESHYAILAVQPCWAWYGK